MGRRVLTRSMMRWFILLMMFISMMQQGSSYGITCWSCQNFKPDEPDYDPYCEAPGYAGFTVDCTACDCCVTYTSSDGHVERTASLYEEDGTCEIQDLFGVHYVNCF